MVTKNKTQKIKVDIRQKIRLREQGTSDKAQETSNQ
jgi:hypothetical protein